MRSRRAWARRIAVAAVFAIVLRPAGFAWGASADTASADAAIPAAHGYVNDVAGVIGETRSAQLEGYLDELQKKTGVQFAVLTVPSTAPEAPEQYKVRAFQAWGIGGKKMDEGLLLLVAMQEHRLVFETGYGLEGTLPDGWEAGMLRDLAAPRFKSGEYADGITAAVLAASQRIAAEKGVTLTWTGDALRYDAPSRQKGGIPPRLIALLIFFLIATIFRSIGGGRRGGWYGGMGPWIGGGWGGGFGGGGGGGGSSFGGFGGGSSGGGGGGAGW
jgi:uncharacterized protein